MFYLKLVKAIGGHKEGKDKCFENQTWKREKNNNLMIKNEIDRRINHLLSKKKYIYI